MPNPPKKVKPNGKLETNENGKENKADDHRLKLGQLPPAKLRDLQEEFGRELVLFLQSSDDNVAASTHKQELLNRVGQKVLKQDIDVRQFDRLLKSLYSDNYLRLSFRRLSDRSDRLKTTFSALNGLTVVAGGAEDNFAEAAAEDLIRTLHRIGRIKQAAVRDGQKPILNVGIVSGSTTGAVIRAATDRKMHWSRNLGINPTELPDVRVFALNVCLTVPQHLAGNSTILAYQLAEKINVEGNGKVKADPYGLSAPLLVKRDQLHEIDREPQTFDVVRYTEPYRVRESLQKLGVERPSLVPSATELDVVLTGVGEKPPVDNPSLFSDDGPQQPKPKGSIFYDLAKQFEFDMDVIVRRNRVVGDIAFTAISSDGEPVPLTKKRSGALDPSGSTTDETPDVEYVFYSAVQLHVLEAMAGNVDKAVILVARHAEDKSKVPAIFASISGDRHRYASRLVVDEKTSEDLVHF